MNYQLRQANRAFHYGNFFGNTFDRGKMHSLRVCFRHQSEFRSYFQEQRCAGDNG